MQTYFTGKEIVKWLAKSTQLGNDRSYGMDLESLDVKSLCYILVLRKLDSKGLQLCLDGVEFTEICMTELR